MELFPPIHIVSMNNLKQKPKMEFFFQHIRVSKPKIITSLHMEAIPSIIHIRGNNEISLTLREKNKIIEAQKSEIISMKDRIQEGIARELELMKDLEQLRNQYSNLILSGI